MVKDSVFQSQKTRAEWRRAGSQYCAHPSFLRDGNDYGPDGIDWYCTTCGATRLGRNGPLPVPEGMPPDVAPGEPSGEVTARGDVEKNFSQGWDSLTPGQRKVVAASPVEGNPDEIIQRLIVMDGPIVVPRVGFTLDDDGVSSYVDATFTDYVRERLAHEERNE